MRPKNSSDFLGPLTLGKTDIAAQMIATTIVIAARNINKFAQAVRSAGSNELNDVARTPSMAVSRATITPTLISAAAIHPKLRSRIHWATLSRSKSFVITFLPRFYLTKIPRGGVWLGSGRPDRRGQAAEFARCVQAPCGCLKIFAAYSSGAGFSPVVWIVRGRVPLPLSAMNTLNGLLFYAAGPAYWLAKVSRKSLFVLAEAVRFELTDGLHHRRFSRPVP